MAKKIPFSCVFASGMYMSACMFNLLQLCLIKFEWKKIDEDLPTYPASELNSHGPHIFGKDFLRSLIDGKIFIK